MFIFKHTRTWTACYVLAVSGLQSSAPRSSPLNHNTTYHMDTPERNEHCRVCSDIAPRSEHEAVWVCFNIVLARVHYTIYHITSTIKMLLPCPIASVRRGSGLSIHWSQIESRRESNMTCIRDRNRATRSATSKPYYVGRGCMCIVGSNVDARNCRGIHYEGPLFAARWSVIE